MGGDVRRREEGVTEEELRSMGLWVDPTPMITDSRELDAAADLDLHLHQCWWCGSFLAKLLGRFRLCRHGQELLSTWLGRVMANEDPRTDLCSCSPFPTPTECFQRKCPGFNCVFESRLYRTTHS